MWNNIKNLYKFKMFTVIFVSLILTSIVLKVFVLSYLDRNYEKDSTQKAILKIESFAKKYSESNWTEEELKIYLNEFNEKNTINIELYNENQIIPSFDENIIDEYRDLLNGENLIRRINFKNSNENIYTILDEKEYALFRKQFTVEDTNNIYLEGFVDNYGFILIENLNGVNMPNTELLKSRLILQSLEKFKGEISVDSVEFFDKKDYFEYNNEKKIMANSLFIMNKIISNKEIRIFTRNLPYTNCKEITLVKNIEKNDKNIRLEAVIWIPLVKEISNVINDYGVKMIEILFVIAIILSGIYLFAIKVKLKKEKNISEQEILKIEEINFKLKEEIITQKNQVEIRKAFISNVSHELKTPLGVIKSYSEAIEDGIKPEKTNKYLGVIVDEVKLMDKLVNEMLTLSRLEINSVEYKYSKFEISGFLKDIIETFDKKIKNKNMKIEYTLTKYNVVADKDKIKQVINNLIGNAIKYGKEGTAIKVENIESNKNVSIFIFNECKSFSEEELKKVWDRFYKRDISHNRNIEGNGLGLSIVKTILEGHNSEFGVYNALKGITFYFSLKKSK